MSVMPDDTPDNRSKPMPVGTWELVFDEAGPEWGAFSRSKSLAPGTTLDDVSADVADAFLRKFEKDLLNSIFSMLSYNSSYVILSSTTRRGSVVIFLELGLSPSDVKFLLAAASAGGGGLLLNALKDYKTFKESVIELSGDLSRVVAFLTKHLKESYVSFKESKFTEDTRALAKIIGAAAIESDMQEEATKYLSREAAEERAKEHQKNLDEKLKRLDTEGRLGSPD